MTFIKKDVQFEQSSNLYKDKSLLSIVKRFLKEFLRGNVIKLCFAILFMIGTGLATSGTAYLIKPMANNVIADTTLKQVYYVGFGFMLVFAVKGICFYFSTFIINTVSFSRAFELQKKLHNKLLSQDVSYFSGISSGRAIPLVTMAGMDGLSGFFAIIFGAVRNFITVLSLISYMVFESLQYFLFACALIVMFYIPFRYINSIVKKIFDKQVAGALEFGNAIADFLRLFPLVKSYNLENKQFNSISNVANDLLHLKLKMSRRQSLLSPLMEVAGGLLVGSVVLIVGMQAVANKADIGQVFSMITAVLLIYQPAKLFLNSLLALSMASVPIRRYFSLIDAPLSLVESEDKKELIGDSFDIELKNVSFSYAGNNVLKDLSITVSKGKKIALVGESGSGKSTVVKLIMKFIEADKGEVCINGINVSELATSSLRGKLGFVGQEIGLFNTTIFENIAIGKKGATKEEVIEVAKKAYAHEFIEKMPNGYDTIIIENGNNLSGGQKQRISIARAILKDSPILIFDEPTSALDNESEIKIDKAIKHITKNKTMITVAHRLSTIQNSDVIYAIKNGVVVEKGSHKELLANKGYYFELCNMQIMRNENDNEN